MFYNGWTHGHYVTNLFGFAPDGMIVFAVINACGSLHDSTLASWGRVYEKLGAVYDRTGLKCIMDSAFASGEHEFILKSAQNYNVTSVQDSGELDLYEAATSMRQAAEWGMGAIQSSFPRLTAVFPYEENPGNRHLLLKLCVYLYNFRAKYVGLNQIRNTFAPHWSKDALYFISSTSTDGEV